MEDLAPWRLAVPAVVAVAFAWFIEWSCARRGVLPPGFRDPLRRWFARLAVGGVLWLGVFQPLGMIGLEVEREFTGVPTPRLFLLHVLLLAALFLWMLAGYAGLGGGPGRVTRPAAGPEPEPAPGDTVEPLAVPAGGVASDPAPPQAMAYPVAVDAASPSAAAYPAPRYPAADPAPSYPAAYPAPAPAAPVEPPVARPSFARRLAAQLGLLTPQPGREIGLGLLLGIGAWAAVIVAIMAIAMVLYLLGGEKLLPKQPPSLVPFIAGLPFLVRLLLSLSAGVVEEIFFRGFLQPRVGIALSTLLFALAHASYGQPFMLVGITVLSLIYAFLVRWRQNVWPAIAAHFLFDAVQLLVVVPAVLKMIGRQGGAGVAALVGIG